MNRQQLATLFGRDYKTISKHINNALKEELADEVVVAKFANTTKHGAIEDKLRLMRRSNSRKLKNFRGCISTTQIVELLKC